jgi:putative transposase
VPSRRGPARTKNDPPEQERYVDCDNATPMSRPPRIKGFSYLGPYRYFITFCTLDRAAVFLDIRLGQSVVWQFRRTCREKSFVILAYCVMPDHVHLLLEGSDAGSNLLALIKTAKQSSGQRFAAGMKRPLWDEGFHDHVLRPEEDPKRFARYVIENPVRAGLVKSPMDYPLSGSDRWTMQELIGSLW